MSRMGMSRAEAKERAGRQSLEGLRRLLAATRSSLEGADGREPSRVNRSLSRSVAWNIYSRAIAGKTDAIETALLRLVAQNILRDFGTSTRIPTKRPVPTVYHEELDPK